MILISPNGTSRSREVFGMLLCGLSSFFFAATGTLVKLTDYPKELLVEARSLLQVIFCFLVVYISQRNGYSSFNVLGPKSLRKYLVWRSILYWAGVVCYWEALTMLEIGDATSFVYSSPIFSGIIAFTWLKEPFRWSYLVFTGVNVIGLLLISKPSFLFNDSRAISTTGILLALIAAFFIGSLGPLVRKSKGAHWVTVELFAHVSSAFFLTPMLLIIKKVSTGVLIPSTPVPWIHILLVSICGFSGLACHTIAYQYAQASTGSLLMYVEIPLAYFLQVVVFGHSVDSFSVCGCVCIVTSGLGSLLWQMYGTNTPVPSEDEELECFIGEETEKAPEEI